MDCQLTALPQPKAPTAAATLHAMHLFGHNASLSQTSGNASLLLFTLRIAKGATAGLAMVAEQVEVFAAISNDSLDHHQSAR